MPGTCSPALAAADRIARRSASDFETPQRRDTRSSSRTVSSSSEYVALIFGMAIPMMLLPYLRVVQFTRIRGTFEIGYIRWAEAADLQQRRCCLLYANFGTVRGARESAT